MRKFFLLTGILTLSGLLHAAVIEIDAAAEGFPVNRKIFGHGVEMADERGIYTESVDAPTPELHGIKYGSGCWDPEKNRPQPVIVDKLKALKTSMLRYPGGCLVHNFDWRKAAGPQDKRGEWKCGIDEFLQICRAVGAEPIITCSDYVLPAEQLPEHLAGLVEYLNAPARPEYPQAMLRASAGYPEPWGVRYFEFGNESDHGNHNCRPARKFTPEEYAAAFLAVSRAMKAVDPNIRLGLATPPGTGSDYACDWNKKVFRLAGAEADFVTIHIYGPRVDGLAPEDALKAAMGFGDQLEHNLGRYRKLIREQCGRELPLAVTEFNLYAIENTKQYRFSSFAGLTVADFLRIFLKPEHAIEEAAYWQIANGYWGAFTTDTTPQYGAKLGNRGIVVRRATLPYFELWADHLGERGLDVAVTGSPLGDAPGTPGAEPSAGTERREEKNLGVFRHNGFYPNNFKANPVFAVNFRSDAALEVAVADLSKEAFPEFAEFSRPADVPPGREFLVGIKFEARYTPAEGSAYMNVGFGASDARGWEATRSATAIYNLQDAAREFTPFVGTFKVRSDFEKGRLLLRFENLRGKASGKLEIRNLELSCRMPGSAPGYQELTAFASRSDAGELNVIVFNKGLRQNEVELKLRNFGPARVIRSELYRPDFAATDAFPPTVSQLEYRENPLRLVLPPHSMTALKFHPEKGKGK